MTSRELHDHDRGLAFDLGTLSRRRALALIGGGLLGVLVGCGADGDTTAAGPTSTSASNAGRGGGGATTPTSGGGCETIPSETAGPFPGDGSNGPNVLREAGIVRSDIRTSFGSMSGTRRACR